MRPNGAPKTRVQGDEDGVGRVKDNGASECIRSSKDLEGIVSWYTWGRIHVDRVWPVWARNGGLSHIFQAVQESLMVWALKPSMEDFIVSHQNHGQRFFQFGPQDYVASPVHRAMSGWRMHGTIINLASRRSKVMKVTAPSDALKKLGRFYPLGYLCCMIHIWVLWFLPHTHTHTCMHACMWSGYYLGSLILVSE